MGPKQVKRKKTDEVQPRPITEFDDDELKDALQGYRMTDEARTCIDAAFTFQYCYQQTEADEEPESRDNLSSDKLRYTKIVICNGHAQKFPPAAQQVAKAHLHMICNP